MQTDYMKKSYIASETEPDSEISYCGQSERLHGESLVGKYTEVVYVKGSFDEDI